MRMGGRLVTARGQGIASSLGRVDDQRIDGTATDFGTIIGRRFLADQMLFDIDFVQKILISQSEGGSEWSETKTDAKPRETTFYPATYTGFRSTAASTAGCFGNFK